MNTNLEDIRILVLQEISGTLTDAGRETLFNEITVNEDAREMRDDMLQVLTPAIVDKIRSQPFTDPADAIINRIHRQKRKKVIAISAIAASAAAAVIALLTIPHLFKPESSNIGITTSQAAQVSNNKNIQLHLAGGQVVNLNTDTSQVIAGNVTMQSSNKTLTYTTNPSANAAEFATLTVPPGKDYTIRLSDGTEVQLNAATSIRFPLAFSSKNREVYINGEAYLKIAKQASQPFTVHLPNTTVRVLGTEFNVNTYDSGVAKVALVQGAVKIVGAQDSLQLSPGQEAVYTSSKLSTSVFDETDVLSWRVGKFLFSNARLEEVCRVIPRLYGISLELDNKEVANKRFSGVIDRHQPVENVLKALKATNGIDYYIDKDGAFHIK
ncbi:FecR family protein [Chitinophaga pinensis]|uniref:Anti-FecI sigma factor, FecR n=1 Tax=Chitinophaga pinensis (strain ATCC 43595 / DSM 2588 / LMG 13176 / NBRC 15968 / NCIMB 11800 / UQM 2034) TaxID=485918 RepID=A0A979FYU9_CHIPD|nr:FecR domain-containing protein [Chitinophaga pinensis]ACU57642.1 anti-FecI sigma factor, FecR [Chitinophaga pinensis DSM 2588]